MGQVNVVLPSSGDADTQYVELARTATGKVYRKQILKMNESFLHPNNKSQKITIDQKFAQKLVDNFKAGYCDTVQFPMVNEKNQHVENPEANHGEVIDLTYDDQGVWAYIDVRKNPEAIGTTVLGASAMMSLDYEDKSNGNHVGPTLLHVAATNRPYLTKLAPYEAVSLSDSENNDNNYIVMLSENETETQSGSESDNEESGSSSMDRLEELLKELSDVYDIDVEALQKAQREAAEASTAEEEAKAEAKVEEAEGKVEESKEKVEEAKDKAKTEEVKAETKEPVAASDSELVEELVAKLSSVLKAADPDLITLSDSDVSIADIANGVIELSNNYKTMSNTVSTLSRKSAEAEVDDAVRAGKILPAQRTAYVELKLSDEKMYKSLVPETAIVALSNEQGVAIHDMPNNGAGVNDDAAEIARIAAKLKNNK